jgi:hypothetical protein
MQGKDYTRMILERLSRKADQGSGKQEALSNLKTQSTLHDTSHSHPTHTRAFFDTFELISDVKYDPVPCPLRRPLRRCLFYELTELEFKKDTPKPVRESRRKLVTLPSSPYVVEQRAASIRTQSRESSNVDPRLRDTPTINPFSLREARPYVSMRKGQKM